jgi:hypothetical protein
MVNDMGRREDDLRSEPMENRADETGKRKQETNPKGIPQLNIMHAFRLRFCRVTIVYIILHTGFSSQWNHVRSLALWIRGVPLSSIIIIH